MHQNTHVQFLTLHCNAIVCIGPNTVQNVKIEMYFTLNLMAEYFSQKPNMPVPLSATPETQALNKLYVGVNKASGNQASWVR